MDHLQGGDVREARTVLGQKWLHPRPGLEAVGEEDQTVVRGDQEFSATLGQGVGVAVPDCLF